MPPGPVGMPSRSKICRDVRPMAPPCVETATRKPAAPAAVTAASASRSTMVWR